MPFLYQTLFPGLTFTGAFLTDDLHAAFLLPLLAKNTSGDSPISGKLYAQIVYPIGYVANGEIALDGKRFLVRIEVRHVPPKIDYGIDLTRFFDLPEKNRSQVFPHLPKELQEEIQQGFQKKKEFLGINKEPYQVGEVVAMTEL